MSTNMRAREYVVFEFSFGHFSYVGNTGQMRGQNYIDYNYTDDLRMANRFTSKQASDMVSRLNRSKMNPHVKYYYEHITEAEH